jgi:hypothetical protein
VGDVACPVDDMKATNFTFFRSFKGDGLRELEGFRRSRG